MPELTLEQQRRLLFVGMLLVVASMKLEVFLAIQQYGPDGTYYADVARLVRDGFGLRSYMSMYHAGFPEFPYPTTIYPIWPLVFGGLAKVLPFDLVAFGAPIAFYFGTVLVGARLAVRLWPRELFPNLWNVPRTDHLFVLAWGFNPLFFEFTSKPYTEGLAWFGFFVMLWRLRAFFATPSLPRAFELGIWAGVLILVRAQMLLVTLAGVGTLVWMVLALRPAKRWTAYAGAAVLGWALALLPQMLWFSTFTEPSFSLLIRFEHYQATDLLERVQMLLPSMSPVELVADRLNGFRIAYRSVGKYSYEANFGVQHWAVPAALVFLLLDARAWIREGGLARVATRLRDPQTGFAVFFALFALGGYLSIHWLHKSYGAEWNFATRHALTVLFLFNVALLYLLSRQGLARLLGVAMVATTAWRQVADLEDYRNKTVRDEVTVQGNRGGLMQFLRSERAKNPGLIVVTDDAQRLAQGVPGMSIHWVWEGTPLPVVERMFTHLHSDYLLAPVKLHTMAFGQDRVAFDERFELVLPNLSGYDVYRYRN